MSLLLLNTTLLPCAGWHHSKTHKGLVEITSPQVSSLQLGSRSLWEDYYVHSKPRFAGPDSEIALARAVGALVMSKYWQS